MLVSTIMLTATVAGVMAQRDNRVFEENVVSVVVNQESADPAAVEQAFKENAPQSPNDNGLPRFAIVGKNKEFYLGIGAQLLGEAVVDFGDNMPSPVLFTPSSMTRPAEGSGASTRFGWQSSSVYLNFVAMPHTDNQIGLFFKGNFMGNDNNFSVYHFYGKYRGLTVGYTTSPFTDAAAEPMTLDFEGPNGYPYTSLFTASWTQRFNENLTGAIGVDAPTASLTTGNGTGTVSQRIPAVPLYVQYGWNGGNSHVRLSGLVRPLQYRNTVDAKNSTMVGLGVQVSGMTHIAGGLHANFNATYGQGIGTYLQDDNGLGLDAMPTVTPGKMDMTTSMGVTGGLSYVFNNRLSTNLTYSHLTNWASEKSVVPGSQYRYGDYVAANVIYNVNRFLSVGLEYDYGHKKSFGGESMHANRLQCQFALTL